MIYLSCKNQHKSTMKNKARISILIAFASLLVAIIATGFAFADDYSYILAGGETQYEIQKETVTKVVQTVVPVGGDVAKNDFNQVSQRFFISSISSDEISIGYNEYIKASDSSTDTSISLGRCKINSEIVIRLDNTRPAIRVKLLSVDMDHGTATLIVTKFWPYPNSPQTKEVDPPTNPEAEPARR